MRANQAHVARRDNNRSMEEATVTDEDNDQSKPLLGDEFLSNDDVTKTVSKAKVAEYLPKPEEKLGIGLRLLRALYGHLPREDVPRVFWVSNHCLNSKYLSLDYWLRGVAPFMARALAIADCNVNVPQFTFYLFCVNHVSFSCFSACHSRVVHSNTEQQQRFTKAISASE